MKNFIPEIISLSVSIFLGHTEQSLLMGCLICLAITVLLRLIWNSAILIHGLGHAVAIAFVERHGVVRMADILEHRSINDVLQSLVPGAPIFIPGLEQHIYPWVAAGSQLPWMIRVKALAGIGCNLLAVTITFQLYNGGYFVNDFTTICFQAFTIANILIAISSWTDINAFVTGIADIFYCGNFGFICQRLDDDGDLLLPERMVNMYSQMGRETEIRGEQAGGGLVIAKDSQEQIVFVGDKVVNRKRANLTNSLEAEFAAVRRKSQRKGISPLKLSTTGVWHYRFGTSGPPAVLETHWHEWMSARYEKVWQFTEGQWVGQDMNVNHRITHNGDFDAWTLYGKSVENAELGLWLERVLHTPNHAKGDSPKIAGMMDFLITQGIWYASVRLAYHLAIADSLESAFGGQQPDRDAPLTVPSEQELSNWAKIFEHTFMLYRRLLAAPNSPSCNQYLCRLEHDVLEEISKNDSISQWTWQKRVNFVRTAISLALTKAISPPFWSKSRR